MSEISPILVLFVAKKVGDELPDQLDPHSGSAKDSSNVEV